MMIGCVPAQGFKTVYSCKSLKIPMLFVAAQTRCFDLVFPWVKWNVHRNENVRLIKPAGRWMWSTPLDWDAGRRLGVFPC